MHAYLKAIGFSKISKRTEMNSIIADVVKNYDEKLTVEDYEDGIFAGFSKMYGVDCGITVCGQYDEQHVFHPEYSFPFFRGTGVTTQEQVIVERHAEKESYAGACDDFRVGVTLIFYLQNPVEYMSEKIKQGGNFSPDNHSLTLSALAKEGTILFPVKKEKEAVKVEQEKSRNRSSLIEAARNGDEEAMESLTKEDMDMYSMISERIIGEDILSIVDSYFMPHGIECDQYKVLGDILKMSVFQNTITGEELVQMTIESNDMRYDVCINRADLVGEPAVGRRFKGIIWLQGQLHF